MKTEELREEIRKMLGGELEPPSDAVKYCLNTMKECIGEMQVCRETIRSYRDKLATLETREVQLSGNISKYEDDIEHFMSATEEG